LYRQPGVERPSRRRTAAEEEPVLARSLGDGVELRLLEERDAAALFALIDANRARLREWLPWVDNEQSPETTRRFLRSAQRQLDDNRGGQYAIVEHGQLAGVVGQHPIDWANRAVNVGYWLGAAYEGRGLMTRACRALVTYAFREQRLHRVEIRAAPANRRSRAIPERLGFRQEGVLRDAEWLYDHHVDLVVYGMLADEWQE
jgi:ribosomal-protein-serine acetyltransferase